MGAKNFISRLARANNTSQAAEPDLLDTADYYVQDAASVSGKKVAGGTGTLVSGVVTIATGLASVLGFSANPATATGTGAAAPQILIVASVTTGAVSVAAYFVSTIGASGALVASTGSSGSFYWTAYGT